VDPSTSSRSACAPPSEPGWFRGAVAELLASEPRFAGIEGSAGRLPWHRRDSGFAGLIRMICGQQVSHQAANAIWRRVSAIPGALDPSILVALDDETLCGQGGLTRARAEHARAVAEAVLAGRLDFTALAAMTETEAIARLTAIRGLGPWTAEVFLVLCEGRADVMPAGDVALQAALAHLSGAATRPDAKALRHAAEAWRPWRGVAARLLWHHWLHVTKRPVLDEL
jgi:DNA-3-methyladenine glycosylase II